MLYLVHHGDAVGPDVNPMRPLSDRGRAEVDRLARQAAERGAKPDVIWHSGKMRARQTAEAYLRCCNPLAKFAAVRGLQPTDLPRLLGRLVTGKIDAPPLDFPLNGVVALEQEKGKWIERWRLGPAKP